MPTVVPNIEEVKPRKQRERERERELTETGV